MKKILLFFVLIFTLNSVLDAQNEEKVKKSQIIENIDGKDYYLHFVKEGETLFAIAKAYDITVNDIFASNPESQKGISPGQILKIRVKPRPEDKEILRENTEQPAYFYHIVKKKETLYGISNMYNVAIEEIKAINPELSDYPREGQTLKIPEKQLAGISTTEMNEVSSIKHTVQTGETLYGIARRYDVSIGEIKNANPGLTDLLDIGQVIVIPNQNKTKSGEKQPSEKKSLTQTKTHVVQEGETIFTIAQQNAVCLDTLKRYNPGLTETIWVGQEIKIPQGTNQKPYIIHKVHQRDKLVRIAREYNVDYGEILALNPSLSKKLKGGERVKIPVSIAISETQTEPVLADTTLPMELTLDCMRNPENSDKVYNIALMLPLFLEEVDSLYAHKNKEGGDIGFISNLQSFRFIQFYEGFQMAVDSLQKKGMNLNLFVYDVDNSPEKVDKVLAASELSSMDLIIGPFYYKAFTRVARFARTYEINIINPVSTRSEILHNNPYVFKLKPGLNYQIDKLLNYLVENYPDDNILLVRNNKYKYQSEVSYIRNYLNSQRDMRVFIPNNQIERAIVAAEVEEEGTLEALFTENKVIEKEMIERSPNDSTYFANTVKEVIYVNDSTTGLKLNLSRVRKNIVIAFADDKVFAQELLSKLNKLNLNHDITLFGLPEWESFDNLEISQLLNLNFHCFASIMVDYRNKNTEKWIKGFRKRFLTEPAENKFAFEGFDVGWYFLTALQWYGKNFNHCLSDYDIDLIHTEFNFEQTDNQGFENTYWNLGKYQDYRFIKVN
ncbi:MAG: LysM peptidoglycan-binding domain-containing protein [Bacteroidales bacterium]|nr:LysM peptidoglycan-binding domain-containing protein [Bacteroidales bacterium]